MRRLLCLGPKERHRRTTLTRRAELPWIGPRRRVGLLSDSPPDPPIEGLGLTRGESAPNSLRA
jgi:hypothetical protein